MAERRSAPGFAPLAVALLAVLTALAAAAGTAGAAPSCAEGPQIVGSTYLGTPCADLIRMPRGVTVARGEGGDDVIYGQRGNDSLFGGEGNDRLYGGIGDDQLRGGPGDDLLSGGFGADSALDGEAGNDLVRGDATIDNIQNTGGGIDTLSYATGVTPGFFDRPGVSEYAGLPGRDGRGAYVNLNTGLGDNGLAPAGGGVDEEVDGAGFEIVIGTAFPDFIVGTEDAQTIYGGGGADVILGEGGGDQVFGGADGDYCDTTGASASECELSGGNREVEPRDPGAVSVGLMAPPAGGSPALYLTGSDVRDEITASYGAGAVTFALGSGSEAGFDVSPLAAGGCNSPAGDQVVCPTPTPPDSLVLAGMNGDDTLAVAGFDSAATEATSVVLLGNEGNDALVGASTEDAIVDGPGADTAAAGDGDDAVPNNEGRDALDAGPGEDLFVSDAVCDGDTLDGGPDRDNANWANFDRAVTLDMGAGTAGLAGPEGQATCPSASLLTALAGLEDIEGTSFADVLIGDGGPNQLLGRPGHDSYFAAAGNDHILANSGDTDLVVDCGEGWDTALIDIPTHTGGDDYEDPAPSGCEDVEERPKNSFRPPGTPPDPDPEPEPPAGEAPPPPLQAPQALPPSHLPPRDRTRPRTRLLHRPARQAFTRRSRRRVAFVFASNEPGARFRCRLDRRRYRSCRSPRRYRLRRGRHVFRVFAVDRAGNRDRSPAVFAFRVRRRPR